MSPADPFRGVAMVLVAQEVAMCVAKGIVRYAVIAGLVGGTALLAAGPETRARLGALVSQARSNVNEAIDSQISDPVALRAQLKNLEGQYGPRLAAVRGDLAELKAQTSQLKRELEVSERVVDLAEQDQGQLQALIERAQEAQTMHASLVTGEEAPKVVRIVFANQPMELDEAYAKSGKIRQVQQAYAQRAADIQRDLAYLGQQEQRLTELNTQLTNEHSQFQAQLWQLDRQVDSIARNDRLIEMMEKRQRTIDEHSRYGATSLDGMQSRFAEIRAKQEARLEALGTGTTQLNYEDRAKTDLDTTKAPTSSTPGVNTKLTRPAKPQVIDITPKDLETPKTEKPSPMVLNNR